MKTIQLMLSAIIGILISICIRLGQIDETLETLQTYLEEKK